MKIEPFKLERWLPGKKSKYSIGGACVKPMRFNELTDDFDMSLEVEYGSTKGDLELRKKLSALYPGTTPEDVLITIGTAEANFLGLSCLLEAGDEFVVITPTYMGSLGIAPWLGAKVRELHLSEEDGYRLNLEQLKRLVGKKTKVVFVTNPNNPTSTKLSESEMQGICDIAKEVGAYVMCDEALRGLELDGIQASSPPSIYEKGISTGSLSKLGLPGLRLGWLIARKEFADACWSYKDYTSLGIPVLSEHFGNIALERKNYQKIVQRARGILKNNVKVLMSWVNRNSAYLSCVEPKAGATGFPKYNAMMDSSAFCEKLLIEESVQVSPGDAFNVPKHFRLRYGGVDERTLGEALSHVEAFLKRLS